MFSFGLIDDFLVDARCASLILPIFLLLLSLRISLVAVVEG